MSGTADRETSHQSIHTLGGILPNKLFVRDIYDAKVFHTFRSLRTADAYLVSITYKQLITFIAVTT